MFIRLAAGSHSESLPSALMKRESQSNTTKIGTAKAWTTTDSPRQMGAGTVAARCVHLTFREKKIVGYFMDVDGPPKLILTYFSVTKERSSRNANSNE